MAPTKATRKTPAPAELSIDNARDVLGDLVARADYGNERTIITRYNKPAAALVPMKDLQRLLALDGQ